jgi:cobaltochelatase CobN
VAAKARRLIALQTKPVAADKRLVAMVYNYPPGGNQLRGLVSERAAQPGSGVGQGLADAGYSTQRVPEQRLDRRACKPLAGGLLPRRRCAARLLRSGQAAALATGALPEQHLASPARGRARPA